jgi:hypothetical protein
MGLLDTKEYTVAMVLSPTDPPAAPLLQSPANGASGMSVPINLVWQSAAGAASYRVQVAKDSSFSQIVWEQDNVTATAIVVSVLEANTQYCWRVRAANAAGNSDWSTVWSFTTGVVTTDIWGSLSSLMALMLVMGMAGSITQSEGG